MIQSKGDVERLKELLEKVAKAESVRIETRDRLDTTFTAKADDEYQAVCLAKKDAAEELKAAAVEALPGLLEELDARGRRIAELEGVTND